MIGLSDLRKRSEVEDPSQRPVGNGVIAILATKGGPKGEREKRETMLEAF